MTPTGTILITGGSGTLGHAIARTARAEGWDCRITVYSRSELRRPRCARTTECRYVLGDVAITTAWPPRSPGTISSFTPPR